LLADAPIIEQFLLTSRVGTEALDLLDKVLALGDLTKDNVLAVQPRGNDGGDEELGSVGVGSSVGHGEQERLVVPELEVLIGELVSVDGLGVRSGASCVGLYDSPFHRYRCGW
jgi:hypothetical protein